MASDTGAASTAQAPDRSDAELLAAFLAGDAQAFTALVDRHSARVYTLCLRYFGNQPDAEDATQEVFLAVYRRAESFGGRAAFTTWLHRVTTNVCHDLARRRASRPRSTDFDPQLLGEAGPDEIHRLELALDLRGALDKLAQDTRELVVLHSVYGMPYLELSQRTGLPVGTVKSRIHRAHGQLSNSLAHLKRMEP